MSTHDPQGGAPMDSRAGGAGGYTLIEIMIVIGIIGIVATLAISTYRNYRNKAFTVEARLGLHNIYKLEQSFRQDNNRYSNNLDEIGFRMAGTPRYSFSLEAGTGSFTARASANLDQDADLDTWEIYFTSVEPVHLVAD